MASNYEFQSVGNQGWLQGYANLSRKENYLWWGTSRWWVQILVWLLIANGILFMVIGIAPTMEKSPDSTSGTQATQNTGQAQDPLDIYGLNVFLKMAGITIAIGVVVLGQDTLINEKQSGTASWVLSKPVSRGAFILSKVVSHALGILITMVVAQGIGAYLIIYFITHRALPIMPFMGAMGMLFISLLFWLGLSIMLGALSNKRGLVIGLPLVFILGYSLFVEIIPWTGEIMPWNLTAAVSIARPALGLTLVTGHSLPTLTPLFGSLIGCLLFIAIAIWRFQKEEF
jgi:ABC-2 type transport system permease protein